MVRIHQLLWYVLLIFKQTHSTINMAGFKRLQCLPLRSGPAAVQVQSKHNTPIEGFWWWKRGEGHNIRDAILVGKAEGLFNPNNEIHV